VFELLAVVLWSPVTLPHPVFEGTVYTSHVLTQSKEKCISMSEDKGHFLN